MGPPKKGVLILGTPFLVYYEHLTLPKAFGTVGPVLFKFDASDKVVFCLYNQFFKFWKTVAILFLVNPLENSILGLVMTICNYGLKNTIIIRTESIDLHQQQQTGNYFSKSLQRTILRQFE